MPVGVRIKRIDDGDDVRPWVQPGADACRAARADERL